MIRINFPGTYGDNWSYIDYDRDEDEAQEAIDAELEDYWGLVFDGPDLYIDQRGNLYQAIWTSDDELSIVEAYTICKGF